MHSVHVMKSQSRPIHNDRSSGVYPEGSDPTCAIEKTGGRFLSKLHGGYFLFIVSDQNLRTWALIWPCWVALNLVWYNYAYASFRCVSGMGEKGGAGGGGLWRMKLVAIKVCRDSQPTSSASGCSYEAGHLVFAATCTCDCDPVCRHLTPSSDRAV
jgi:hypothetical protein